MLIIAGAKDEDLCRFVVPVKAQVSSTSGTDGMGDNLTGYVQASGRDYEMAGLHWVCL